MMFAMTIWDYVKRHHVGLLALVLILTGGTAYAASSAAHLPKNSVASKQVKNGSLQGKDLKDGTVASADVANGSLTGADVADGGLTGADLADGSVAGADLAPGAVADTRIILVSDEVGGDAATVFSDPAIGTITLTCTGVKGFTVTGSLASTATPGSVHVMGTDVADTNPIGAQTFSNTTPGGSGGNALYATTDTVLGQGLVFFDTATRRLSFRWNSTIAPCVLRGELVITRKPA